MIIPMFENIIADITDNSYSADIRLQHARYALEGYRDYARGYADYNGCPYSPGSSRAHSWETGMRAAMEDGIKPAKYR